MLLQGCYHGGNLEDGEYDYEHNGLKLRDFVFHKHSQGCDLSEAHVLAVRIYTTSSYPKLNRPLRNRPVVPGKTRFLPHPFRMTVYYLDEGLRKLRTVAAKKQYFSDKSLLYRGVYGELNEEELEKSGGIERAPMSTSNQMHTAASYVNAFSSQVYVWPIYMHTHTDTQTHSHRHTHTLRERERERERESDTYICMLVCAYTCIIMRASDV